VTCHLAGTRAVACRFLLSPVAQPIAGVRGIPISPFRRGDPRPGIRYLLADGIHTAGRETWTIFWLVIPPKHRNEPVTRLTALWVRDSPVSANLKNFDNLEAYLDGRWFPFGRHAIGPIGGFVRIVHLPRCRLTLAFSTIRVA